MLELVLSLLPLTVLLVCGHGLAQRSLVRRSLDECQAHGCNDDERSRLAAVRAAKNAPRWLRMSPERAHRLALRHLADR